MRAGSAGHAAPATPRAPSRGARPESIYSATFLCALGYLIVDYGRPQDWIPGIGLLRPGVLALGAGLAAMLFYGGLPTGRLPRLMLAFLGYMIFLVPLALNRNWAFWTTWSLMLTFFGGLMPIIAFVDNLERLKRLLRLWLGLHVSMALWGLNHAGQGNGSFLIDENDLALALNTALPYTFYLCVLERKLLAKLFAAGAAFLLLFGVVSTMSRGGFVGLACVSLMIWLQSRRKVVSFVAAVATAAVVYAGSPASYWQEVLSIQNADNEEDTGFQRLYSWGIGWRMFLDNPVLGVGPNNYPHRAAEYEDETSDRIGYHMWGREAHSLPVTLISELGIVGTAIYLTMLGHGVRSRRRLRKLGKIVLARIQTSDEDRDKVHWICLTSSCIDASLVGLMASAVFLSALYYPHAWVLTAFSAVLWNVGEPMLTAMVAQGDPSEQRPSPGRVATPARPRLQAGARGAFDPHAALNRS